MSSVFSHLPKPLNGVNWEPTPSDYTKLPAPAKYGDTDFANADFDLLWGEGSTGNPGRNDLATIQGMGFNTVKMYNWSVPAPNGYWMRDHAGFLSTAKTLGLSVIVPISNYFTGMAYNIRTSNGNPGGPATGSVTADTLKGWMLDIVTEVYSDGSTPGSVVMWAIANEYDNQNNGSYGYCESQDIATIASYIADAETSLGISSDQVLPFSSPVTTALSPVNTSIPNSSPYNTLMGGCATQDLINAFTNAGLNDRFMACINSYQTGAQLTGYYTDFATIFPGLNFYYGELGWSEANGGEDLQAKNVYNQFSTTIPEAQASTYYYGACLFEYTDELWKGPSGSSETTFGILTFSGTAPTQNGTEGNHAPVWGATYPVDQFVERKAYSCIVSALNGTTPPSHCT